MIAKALHLQTCRLDELETIRRICMKHPEAALSRQRLGEIKAELIRRIQSLLGTRNSELGT